MSSGLSEEEPATPRSGKNVPIGGTAGAKALRRERGSCGQRTAGTPVRCGPVSEEAGVRCGGAVPWGLVGSKGGLCCL